MLILHALAVLCGCGFDWRQSLTLIDDTECDQPSGRSLVLEYDVKRPGFIGEISSRIKARRINFAKNFGRSTTRATAIATRLAITRQLTSIPIRPAILGPNGIAVVRAITMGT
jgi:hypothetical protein